MRLPLHAHPRAEIRRPRSRRSIAWIVAVAAPAVACALLVLLWPVLEHGPFVAAFAAVIVAAAVGGRRPGLLALALVSVAVPVILTRRGTMDLGTPDDVGLLIFFVAAGVPLALLVGAFRDSRDAMIRARETAEHETQRLAMAFEATSDAVCQLDEHFRFTMVNSEAERLLRRPRGSLLGTTVWESFPEVIGTRIESEFRRTLSEGRRVAFTDFYRPLDRWFRIRVHPTDHGLAIYFRDATERVRARERRLLLERAGESLSASLDYEKTLTQVVHLAVPSLADMAIVHLASDGGVRRVAVAHVDPAKEVEINAIPSIHGPFAPDHPITRAMKGEALLAPEVPQAWREALMRIPGHAQILRIAQPRSLMFLPLVARGRILGVISFATAESRRAYEEADLETGLELARRAAIALDNAMLFREAQEAIRIRDQFLSVASHELKTPLTALRAQLQFLQRDLGDRDKAEERTRRIGRYVRRLTRLVNDLLDVSFISGGELRIHPETTDVGRLVREVAQRMEAEAERAGSPLEVQTEKIPARIDPLRVDRVVAKLIGNAIKYGEKKPIRVQASHRDGETRIEIIDHGMGIPEGYLPWIFTRFGQAVSPGQYGGLGLGLYIADQIVRAHGGRIEVQSREGKGSTFVVHLPDTATA